MWEKRSLFSAEGTLKTKEKKIIKHHEIALVGMTAGWSIVW